MAQSMDNLRHITPLMSAAPAAGTERRRRVNRVPQLPHVYQIVELPVCCFGSANESMPLQVGHGGIRVNGVMADRTPTGDRG